MTLFERRVWEWIESRPDLRLACGEVEEESLTFDAVRNDEDWWSLVIAEYKVDRWAGRSQPRCDVACDERGLARKGRRFDEKALVACGWEHMHADCVCAYCNAPISLIEMEIEHVHPRALGGSGQLKNLVPACPQCNDMKADGLTNEVMSQLGMASHEIDRFLSRCQEATRRREQIGAIWASRISAHKLEKLGVAATPVQEETRS